MPLDPRSSDPLEALAGRFRRLTACVALASVTLAATPALADDYDPDAAGHPLRIVAYVLHPVGVLIDYLIMRPAHWIAGHEPITTIVGHDDEGL